MKSTERACQIPDFTPCDPAELSPLLRRLEGDEPVAGSEVFPRGTLLADGRLDLCKQRLGPEGARAVAKALRGNTRVSSVLLGADNIGNPGAIAVADLMRENRTITTVFLGCNQIDAAGAGALASALEDHPTLRALWIKRNPIGKEGAAAIALALPSARSLRTLDLAQTGLSTESGHLIAAAVVRCPSLQRLYLSGNDLTAEDIPWIGKLLHPGSPITALYLTANRLGDEGARQLAAALSENRTLTTLGLGSNGIGTEGIRALAEALRHHPTLETLDLGRAPSTALLGLDDNRIDDEAAAALADQARHNASLRVSRAAAPPDEDVRAIRSVYRTAAPATKTNAAMGARPIATSTGSTRAAAHETTSRTTSAPLPEIEISESDLASCAAVLRALRARPDRFMTKDPGRTRVRAEANRLVDAIRQARQDQKQQMRRDEGARAQARRRAHDRALVETTGIRAERTARADALGSGASKHASAALPVGELASTALSTGETEPAAPRASTTTLAHATVSELEKPRNCYICKAPYRLLHSFYDALCPPCAAYNEAKRRETADLRGRLAVVTGGRVKIGYHVALKLLRAGARVIVTTRFPCDAAMRFGREPDHGEWLGRLEIHGLDLRHLSAVEAFAGAISREYEAIDVLVNNAAQTVRRPPAFFEHLQGAELRGPAALPDGLGALVSPRSYHEEASRGGAPGPAAASLLSQVPLLEGDERRDTEAFPLDTLAGDGQQLDRRDHNSWGMALEDVTPWELVEVHCVNAFAPFLLIRRLLPRMAARGDGRDRYIVNVSAMEGKFDYAAKQADHPHTNMAKAALNMLTRTAGPDLARRGVLVSSVDTGWITFEQAYPIAERMRERGFEPPLDEIDGASRILDPVFQGVNGGARMHSVFLKDYRPTDW